MAYISPSMVTTGDLITAAEWNQDIVANEQASAPDMFTTKGDLFVATAADTGTRLGVGTNGDVLMADSVQSAGVAWNHQFMRVANRQGGNSSLWPTPGSNNYVPTSVLTQIGIAEATIADGDSFNDDGFGLPDLLISFPTAFSAAPLVWVTLTADTSGYTELVTVCPVLVGSTGCYIYVRRAGTSGVLTVQITWLAIGPA